MMRKINFHPFPTLTTERLTLRQSLDSDADAIFILRSDEEANKFVVRTKPTNRESTPSFIKYINSLTEKNESIFWVICEKADPNLIGTICLWNFSEDKTCAEMGYELSLSSRRKGIMSEALKCVLNFSFHTLKLETIEAFTHKDNVASTRMLAKNNFIHAPGRIDKGNSNNVIYFLKKSGH